tara:strand:- start:301 stop:477 length:177 start_codon:yes stop_codon:yes gene_type:complete
MRYFCLDSKGKLWDLCDCGDFDAAEESAIDMGVESIWIFNEDDAKDWNRFLNRQLNYD